MKTAETWLPIFRAGDYRDQGKGVYTRSDLDTIARNYADKYHEAPLVIGHPATNAPAYGWVESLKRNGDVLMAKFRDVAESFVELWTEKRFNKFSASFYHDLDGRGKYLRHVGALGAMPPGVKALPNVEFAGGKNHSEIAISFDDLFKTPSVEYEAQAGAEYDASADEYREYGLDRKTYIDVYAGRKAVEAFNEVRAGRRAVPEAFAESSVEDLFSEFNRYETAYRNAGICEAEFVRVMTK